jgi:hypothetical protein
MVQTKGSTSGVFVYLYGMTRDSSHSLNFCSFTIGKSSRAKIIYSANSALSIQNSSFSGNSVGDGGCICASNVDLKVFQSKFWNCSAINGAGGAIFVSSSLITLNDTEFRSNSARNGGSVAMSYAMSCRIISCRFINSIAASNGGAIFIADSFSLNAAISNSSFISNGATNGAADLISIFQFRFLFVHF